MKRFWKMQPQPRYDNKWMKTNLQVINLHPGLPLYHILFGNPPHPLCFVFVAYWELTVAYKVDCSSWRHLRSLVGELLQVQTPTSWQLHWLFQAVISARDFHGFYQTVEMVLSWSWKQLFDAAPTNRIQAEVVRTTIIVQNAYTNVIK